MIEFNEDHYQQLIQKKVHGIPLADEMIPPAYDGQSILNIPPTIAALLDVPLPGKIPLSQEITSHLPQKINNVILVLMDALALHRFRSWTAANPDLVWNYLASDSRLLPLTSITPSTTSAAITTLWTGASAAEHGVMGYEMWLKQYGMTINTILHKPFAFQKGTGSLKAAGFDPLTFLPVESIADSFQEHGVDVHAFQHSAIIHSGLSEMFMGNAVRHPIRSPADLWIDVRRLLEEHQDRRKYLWVYWGNVDHLSHVEGPDDERPGAEFTLFSAAMERFFLNQLSPEIKKKTLLILTADHGQKATDKTLDHYHLKYHPEFLEMLHLQPTGESRLAYLHIRPGYEARVRQYVQEQWPNEFMLMDAQQAVSAGLFGPGRPHPDLNNRVGDLVAAARGEAYWWRGAQENPLIGRHGGLSAEEMVVPFLAVPL